MPFEPSHENMANLKLYPDQPVEVLAADLRRAFSGIVAGNVKEVGIRAIEEFGPYKNQRRQRDYASYGRPATGFCCPASYEVARLSLHPLLRNLHVISPPPVTFVAGFLSFFGHLLINSFHLLYECFLPTSRDKYHHS